MFRSSLAGRTPLFVSFPSTSSWSTCSKPLPPSALRGTADKPGRVFSASPKGVLQKQDAFSEESELCQVGLSSGNARPCMDLQPAHQCRSLASLSALLTSLQFFRDVSGPPLHQASLAKYRPAVCKYHYSSKYRSVQVLDWQSI